MTKEQRERKNQKNKEWNNNNKDKVIAAYKKYYLKNKEKRKEYLKEYRANQKDGYHRVYLLEDYNYVGVTNNISHRFCKHKSEHNRDCTNHRVLYKTKDRSEALELEALLHDMGYEGKNNKYA